MRSFCQATRERRAERPQCQEEGEVGSRGHRRLGRRREIGDRQPRPLELAQPNINPEVDRRMRQAQSDHRLRLLEAPARNRPSLEQAMEIRLVNLGLRRQI